MRRGLGRAVAETLVGEGARVIPVSRDEGALDEVAAALGDAAVPFAADLADATAVDALAARVNAEVGALDGILVNAGGPPPGSTLDFSDEQREGAFRFLIGGPVRLLRALVARLNEGASTLFVTSLSVRQPIHRVRFLDERRAQAASVSVDEQVERMVKTIPLGRYGDPAELGRVAAFLLSRRPRCGRLHGRRLSRETRRLRPGASSPKFSRLKEPDPAPRAGSAALCCGFLATGGLG